MNIKKTDIFSGVGVFTIQMIANGICYAFKKNNVYLGMGIVFAFVVSIFIGIIVNMNRKLKSKELYYKEKIDNLGVDNLKNECNELRGITEGLKTKISDIEQERDAIEQQLSLLEQDVELYSNKCNYYTRMDFLHQKILYLLKNKKNCEKGEFQGLIDEIEYIFRDDIFIKNANMNSSIFLNDNGGKCYILVSTRHSPGTISRLLLDDKSLVGTSFGEKRVIYCGDIDNRKVDIPFIEIDNNRKYKSILAVPCISDDRVEFVLVITCNKRDCLEQTYIKYQDVIHRYLELLGILLSTNFNKEEK